MTELQGRFLGGRPPYGYRLADAGPHPKLDKAASGVRLHRLEPDPITASVVARIFEMYLAGDGLRTIAQALTDDGIPCPSAYDPERNRHRLGHAWAFAAVRAILTNPRYTGRAVWGRQPRHETLIDPRNPDEGHIVQQRWVPESQWVWSQERTHEAIVDDGTWQKAQARLTKKATSIQSQPRSSRAEPGKYLLTGIVSCGLCGRKLSGFGGSKRPAYKCRVRFDYATVRVGDNHPRTLSVSERRLIRTVDEWLKELFDTERRDRTVAHIVGVGGNGNGPRTQLEGELREIEGRIRRIGDALEAGVLDPDDARQRVGRLRARRDAALAELELTQTVPGPTVDDILAVLDDLGGIIPALKSAPTHERQAIYKNTGLAVVYHPIEQEVDLSLTIRGVPKVGVGGGKRAPSPRSVDVDTDWLQLPAA